MAEIEQIPFEGSVVSQLAIFAKTQPTKRFCRLQSCGKGQEINYESLYVFGLKYAGLLRGNGVGKGDVVPIFLPAHPEMYAAFVGAMLIGAIPSFMPGPSGKQDVGRFWNGHRALMERVKPAAIIATPALQADIERSFAGDGAPPVLVPSQARELLDPQHIVVPDGRDTAFLQHSSGTTGLKKGVAISHAALRIQINSYARALQLTGEDVIATWLPVYHDMGLITSTLMPMMMGLSVVALDPFEWAADPGELLEAMTQERATLTWMPNFAFEHLVRSVPRPCESTALDLAHVRAFINCSERCFPSTFERFAAHFHDAGVRMEQLQVSYAMAETVFAISQTPLDHAVRTVRVDADLLRTDGRATAGSSGASIELLSNGPVIDGIEARIIDALGNTLQDGAVGEIAVSGSCIFAGYQGQPDITAQRLRNGLYHTRDRGFMLDGELYILGRTDDLVIVHGKNFHASEIEAAASRVAGVRPGRVAATGRLNAETGTTDVFIFAETVGIDEPAHAALKRAVKAAIFDDLALTVHGVSFVPAGTLRKTTSGKISREKMTTPESTGAPQANG